MSRLHHPHSLADEAETAQPNVKYKQWVHGDSHTVADDAAAAENADARGHRPDYEYAVDRNPGNGGQAYSR